MSLFLRPFGEALTEALQPLKTAVSAPSEMENLLLELGWKIDIDNTTIVYVANAFQTFTDLVDDATALFEDIQNETGNAVQQAQNVLDLAQKIKDFFDTVNGFDASGTPNIPPPMDQGFFWDDIVITLPPYLISKYLQENQPLFYGSFLAIGVIDISDQAPAGANRVKYKKYTINIGNLGTFVTNTPQLLRTVYNWDNLPAQFDHHKLLYNLEQFALGLRLLVTRAKPPRDLYINSNYFTDPQVESQNIEALSVPIITGQPVDESGHIEVGALLMPIPDALNNPPSGLLLTPIANGSLNSVIPLTPEITLSLSGEFSGTGVFGIKIFPSGANLDTNFSNGTIVADLKLEGKPQDPDKPWILIGAENESRIELEGFEANLGVHGVFNDVEVIVKLGTSDDSKLRFVLQPSDGDSFISKIFGSNPLELETEGKISWSSKSGFGIEGHVGFEIRIPIHKELGPILLESIMAKLDGKTTGTEIVLALDAVLKIGPFTAVVNEIGVEFNLTDKTASPNSGILGNIDVDFGFKPPKGLGLSVDSGAVKGAGYLSFNKDEGRYIGALELRIKDEIAVKAIGILTTKLPGGQTGYSLLLLITAEFQPIQLGFGFTLNGVGGLIALNRKMNFDALRTGVRNNTLEDILFPKDPVANINSIVSTLEDSFPVAEGRYSFGPMAIIGWGSPTLITAELGLFIEVPDPIRIAIIGVIKAILPDLDAPILTLQINFAGTIDFEAKFITFDASLFDSKLLWLPLSGDMAFRLKWGDDPAFVMSVGGFYPGFPVPPLNLPDLRRITVNLLDGDNPRLTLSTYFAVTSNTAQFGASVDFYYSYSNKIKITGGVGFDALFRFSPFYFTSTIHGDLSVSFKGKNILSVSLEGTLEGPTPWHLQGTVSFDILCFSYTADFDRTFGDYQNTTLPDIQVLPLLEAALQDKKNWLARLPENIPQLVTIRNLPVNSTDVVVHPQGMMAVNQKVVPLNMTINRYGNQRPSDHHYFSITLSHAPGVITYSAAVLKEYFAPSEYFDLSQDERLGRKSFEQYPSGLQVTNVLTGLESGGFFEMPQEYETTVMDSKYKPVRLLSNTQMSNAHQSAMLRGSAAALSTLGSVQSGSSFTAPAKVVVEQESYVVAQTYDLTVYQNLTAGSEAEALMLLSQTLAANPELEGKLNVIHSFELA